MAKKIAYIEVRIEIEIPNLEDDDIEGGELDNSIVAIFDDIDYNFTPHEQHNDVKLTTEITKYELVNRMGYRYQV